MGSDKRRGGGHMKECAEEDSESQELELCVVAWEKGDEGVLF